MKEKNGELAKEYADHERLQVKFGLLEMELKEQKTVLSQQVKLTWRQGESPPTSITSDFGTAVIHGNRVFSYLETSGLNCHLVN